MNTRGRQSSEKQRGKCGVTEFWIFHLFSGENYILNMEKRIQLESRGRQPSEVMSFSFNTGARYTVWAGKLRNWEVIGCEHHFFQFIIMVKHAAAKATLVEDVEQWGNMEDFVIRSQQPNGGWWEELIQLVAAATTYHQWLIDCPGELSDGPRSW